MVLNHPSPCDEMIAIESVAQCVITAARNKLVESATQVWEAKTSMDWDTFYTFYGDGNEAKRICAILHRSIGQTTVQLDSNSSLCEGMKKFIDF